MLRSIFGASIQYMLILCARVRICGRFSLFGSIALLAPSLWLWHQLQVKDSVVTYVIHGTRFWYLPPSADEAVRKLARHPSNLTLVDVTRIVSIPTGLGDRTGIDRYRPRHERTAGCVGLQGLGWNCCFGHSGPCIGRDYDRNGLLKQPWDKHSLQRLTRLVACMTRVGKSCISPLTWPSRHL